MTRKEAEKMAGNAELAEWKAKSEESFAFYEDLRKQYEAARKELAGSENNRQALAEALDGMQKTLTETQKALDDAQQARERDDKLLLGVTLSREKIQSERDTANDLLREAAKWLHCRWAITIDDCACEACLLRSAIESKEGR